MLSQFQPLNLYEPEHYIKNLSSSSKFLRLKLFCIFKLPRSLRVFQTLTFSCRAKSYHRQRVLVTTHDLHGKEVFSPLLEDISVTFMPFCFFFANKKVTRMSLKISHSCMSILTNRLCKKGCLGQTFQNKVWILVHLATFWSPFSLECVVWILKEFL